MTDIARTEAWAALKTHAEEMQDIHMKDLFDNDRERFRRFSIIFEDMLVDFSKNRISEKTIDLLIRLAEASDLKAAIEAMFAGERINTTENRAVLHTALRNPPDKPVLLDGKDVMPDVYEALKKMERFSEQMRSGELTGFSGKRIRTVVHIGIGGSYLGPAMIYEALKPYAQDGPEIRFVSNVDAADFTEQTRNLDPETTFFIIASKTFTTQETMTNAQTARKWFLEKTGNLESAVKHHFAALSVNQEEVEKFGVDPENMFVFWDWVGGRYSWASSIGTAVACGIGFDRFSELLDGAHVMDMHFKTAPLKENIPVILAMIGVWYNNFFGSESLAILPYDQRLARFPAYLQQCDMESNGKSVDIDGNPVACQTGPIVWGEPGTNGQHAFYQLLHQGTKLVPADFIGFVNSHDEIGDHHLKLTANFFAQTEALMKGRDDGGVKAEGADKGFSEDKQSLPPHKRFPGNRPTNSILLKQLTPRALGMLISLYEMKIFAQGVVWRINSFDQWGVELGKVLAGKILSETTMMSRGDSVDLSGHDSSTQGLLGFFQANRPVQDRQ